MTLRILSLAMLAAMLLVGSTTAAEPTTVRGPDFPFFAFDNGVGRGTLSADEQAKLLAEFGYDGIGYTGTRDIPAMLEALDEHGLKFYSTYVSLNLEPPAGETTYEAGLPDAIQQLKGRGTIIWLHVHGGSPSSTALDTRAVDAIRQIADMADESGLRVALYPHVGFYVATIQDAVRLAKKVDRANVGASFNLCHFLKLDEERNIEARLAEAIPHLFVVSINGADRGKTREMNWDRLIQTLDAGDFDIDRLLRQLKNAGYIGPVGLQCYGVRGDVRENLRRSIKAWNGLVNSRTTNATQSLD